MKLFKKLKIKPGFSLMEVLVVLFIISTALLGVLSLLIQNIQVQNINKNNLIASSLSQEGIELIRQVRDMNWQNSRPFATNLMAGSYSIDYRSSTPAVTASAAPLYIKDGLYIHKNGGESGLTPTIFSRQIVINKLDTHVGNGKYLQVRSIVSWTDHNHPYHYELQTLLYDWH